MAAVPVQADQVVAVPQAVPAAVAQVADILQVALVVDIPRLAPAAGIP
jgi:hypothetical protein